MKITAKSSKKKEAFKPITVTLEIVIESEKELEELKDISRDYTNNKLDDVYYNDGDYTTPFSIVNEIAKQL